MPDTDNSEWRLYAVDLTTQLAVLPAITSHFYLEMSEPGSGELKIPLDSPAAAMVTEGMLCVNYYRGASRKSFFVDNLKITEADSSEGAGRILSLAGRGGLGLLEMARVADNGAVTSSREFTGMTKAAILLSLIAEAQARGGLSVTLTSDFTATDDSASTAWTDSEEWTIPVGTTLLDVLRQFARTEGIDFDINYSGSGFVLSAYKDNGIGTNLASTVFMTIGKNCIEVTRETRGGMEVQNALQVKWRDGYINVEDAPSIGIRGRREGFLSLEAAQSVDSATTFAAARLEQIKDPQESIVVRVYDGIEPYLFIDYALGDTVSIDSFGVVTSYRILGIQADTADYGYSKVTLKTNSIFYDNDMRMERELDWLLDQWNTARDADLLEVRRWVALGLTTDIISEVAGLFVSGDTIYVAGVMGTIGGQAVNNFASYNMVTGIWESYGQFPFSAGNNCVCVIDGEIYMSGDNQNIWHWNGTFFDSIGQADFLDAIFVMATDGTDLYIGGNFAIIDGVSNTKGVARYQVSDGTWHALGAGLLNEVRALFWDNANNRLIIGGDIPSHDNICAWNGTSFDDFDTGLDGSVLAITMQGTDVIAGGEFTDYLSSWDGAAWTTISGITNVVRGLTTYLTDVYVVGDFSGGILRYSGGVFFDVTGGINGQGYAVVMHGTTVIVGGDNITVAGGDVPGLNLFAHFTGFESLSDFLTNQGSTYDLGAGIHGARAVTVLTDNDEFPLWDDSTQLLRKITWANMKAAIAAAFGL